VSVEAARKCYPIYHGLHSKRSHIYTVTVALLQTASRTAHEGSVSKVLACRTIYRTWTTQYILVIHITFQTLLNWADILHQALSSLIRTAQPSRRPKRICKYVQHVSLASIKSLHHLHHHYRLSSVQLFIPCIEQP
jgi:hypothetical protein